MQRIEKLKISLKSLKNMNAEWGNKGKKTKSDKLSFVITSKE